MFVRGAPGLIVRRFLCRYFSEPRHRGVLFPTLIAACHQHFGNAAVAGNDLALELLAEFLEENLGAWQAEEPPVDGFAGASSVGWLGVGAISILGCGWITIE